MIKSIPFSFPLIERSTFNFIKQVSKLNKNEKSQADTVFRFPNAGSKNQSFSLQKQERTSRTLYQHRRWKRKKWEADNDCYFLSLILYLSVKLWETNYNTGKKDNDIPRFTGSLSGVGCLKLIAWSQGAFLSRQYLLSKFELIAWHLRHPWREMLRGPRILVNSQVS